MDMMFPSASNANFDRIDRLSSEDEIAHRHGLPDDLEAASVTDTGNANQVDNTNQINNVK
jgi:hypothetical protein